MTPRLAPTSYASLRAYATASGVPPRLAASSPQSPFAVFDRKLKKLQRDRAAGDPERSRLTDYVKDEIAASMVDRLLDIKRRFPSILDVGAGPGFIAKHLDMDITQHLTMTDSSSQRRIPALLRQIHSFPLFFQKRCSTAISTSKQKVHQHTFSCTPADSILEQSPSKE